LNKLLFLYARNDDDKSMRAAQQTAREEASKIDKQRQSIFANCAFTTSISPPPGGMAANGWQLFVRHTKHPNGNITVSLTD